ncbi:MAG: hypothetical protein QGH40_01460, partial [bacterium]|nr:hypothetical protein [bacterium]
MSYTIGNTIIEVHTAFSDAASPVVSFVDGAVIEELKLRVPVEYANFYEDPVDHYDMSELEGDFLTDVTYGGRTLDIERLDSEQNPERDKSKLTYTYTFSMMDVFTNNPVGSLYGSSDVTFHTFDNAGNRLLFYDDKNDALDGPIAAANLFTITEKPEIRDITFKGPKLVVGQDRLAQKDSPIDSAYSVLDYSRLDSEGAAQADLTPVGDGELIDIYWKTNVRAVLDSQLKFQVKITDGSDTYQYNTSNIQLEPNTNNKYVIRNVPVGGKHGERKVEVTGWLDHTAGQSNLVGSITETFFVDATDPLLSDGNVVPGPGVQPVPNTGCLQTGTQMFLNLDVGQFKYMTVSTLEFYVFMTDANDDENKYVTSGEEIKHMMFHPAVSDEAVRGPVFDLYFNTVTGGTGQKVNMIHDGGGCVLMFGDDKLGYMTLKSTNLVGSVMTYRYEIDFEKLTPFLPETFQTFSSGDPTAFSTQVGNYINSNNWTLSVRMNARDEAGNWLEGLNDWANYEEQIVIFNPAIPASLVAARQPSPQRKYGSGGNTENEQDDIVFVHFKLNNPLYALLDDLPNEITVTETVPGAGDVITGEWKASDSSASTLWNPNDQNVSTLPDGTDIYYFHQGGFIPGGWIVDINNQPIYQ